MDWDALSLIQDQNPITDIISHNTYIITTLSIYWGETSVNNKQMRNAQITKCDEFYTRRETIEKELEHWPDLFKNKIVYCNCDTDDSEFVKYFKDNFTRLGLKRLIYSTYAENAQGHYTAYSPDSIITSSLNGNGAFDSEECIDLLRHSDIVVTNPPFSMQRYYQLLMFNEQKDYLILGNMNTAVTPFLKDLIGPYSHFGYSIRSGGVKFNIPCGMENTENIQIIDGK